MDCVISKIIRLALRERPRALCLKLASLSSSGGRARASSEGNVPKKDSRFLVALGFVDEEIGLIP